MEYAAQFNAEKEVQVLPVEINGNEGSMSSFFGMFTAAQAEALKKQEFAARRSACQI